MSTSYYLIGAAVGVTFGAPLGIFCAWLYCRNQLANCATPTQSFEPLQRRKASTPKSFNRMKATKKPKRPNPFRSNLGIVNVYQNTRRHPHSTELPPIIGSARINRSGHQHMPPPLMMPNSGF